MILIFTLSTLNCTVLLILDKQCDVINKFIRHLDRKSFIVSPGNISKFGQTRKSYEINRTSMIVWLCVTYTFCWQNLSRISQSLRNDVSTAQLWRRSLWHCVTKRQRQRENLRKCNKQKIQWFKDEYGIYFTRETGIFFLYFHECEARVKISKNPAPLVK